MDRRTFLFRDKAGLSHRFAHYSWPASDFSSIPDDRGCYLLTSANADAEHRVLWVGRAAHLRAKMLDHACAGSDLRMRLKIASPGHAPSPTHLFVAADTDEKIVAFYDTTLGPVRAALDPEATGCERVLKFLFPALCDYAPTHRRLLEDMRRLYGAQSRFRLTADGDIAAPTGRSAIAA